MLKFHKNIQAELTDTKGFRHKIIQIIDIPSEML